MNGGEGTAASAFDAIYARLHPPLLRYLDRMVGDADAAEDIAQESFVRLLKRPELTGEDARLWLFAVATNLARDRGRTTSRRERLLKGNPLGGAQAPLADEEMVRAERIEGVRAALAQLNQRDRQLLLMREEGFRYAEIAEVVGVAPGSVGTLIARAVKRFVEVYGPNEANQDASG